MDEKTIEALAKGECAVERFYGQTVIYIPNLLADRLTKREIKIAAEEIFPPKELERFGWTYWKGKDYACVELPSVIDELTSPHPRWNHPSRIIDKILEQATPHNI
ncbi:MAG TPA: hypothetical protein VJJ21_00430 [Candidatus Nanoarchaeia archaeon]|nr:hypothetical protein [Candidatus Nanoarchaeia archaeon]